MKTKLRRSGAKIMASLIVLLGSLSYIMVLAVINGSVGFIAAMGVTVAGATGVAKALGIMGLCAEVYIAYKKECTVNFRLVLSVPYLSVCNRYECYVAQGSASGCFVPSLRRL